ncbi:hypothetical protein Bca4012_097251 [Brassica carinata]
MIDVYVCFIKFIRKSHHRQTALVQMLCPFSRLFETVNKILKYRCTSRRSKPIHKAILLNIDLPSEPSATQSGNFHNRTLKQLDFNSTYR